MFPEPAHSIPRREEEVAESLTIKFCSLHGEKLLIRRIFRGFNVLWQTISIDHRSLSAGKKELYR
jgi:hypothetical protein